MWGENNGTLISCLPRCPLWVIQHTLNLKLPDHFWKKLVNVNYAGTMSKFSVVLRMSWLKNYQSYSQETKFQGKKFGKPILDQFDLIVNHPLRGAKSTHQWVLYAKKFQDSRDDKCVKYGFHRHLCNLLSNQVKYFHHTQCHINFLSDVLNIMVLATTPHNTSFTNKSWHNARSWLIELFCISPDTDSLLNR